MGDLLLPVAVIFRMRCSCLIRGFADTPYFDAETDTSGGPISGREIGCDRACPTPRERNGIDADHDRIPGEPLP